MLGCLIRVGIHSTLEEPRAVLTLDIARPPGQMVEYVIQTLIRR